MRDSQAETQSPSSPDPGALDHALTLVEFLRCRYSRDAAPTPDILRQYLLRENRQVRPPEILQRAHEMQVRAAEVGFDWPTVDGAMEKVREEIEEVAAELGGGDVGRVEEEIGDLLFSVVNLARLAGTHAQTALAVANAKFERRFRGVEALAGERGLVMESAGLEALDQLWGEVKEAER